MSYRGYRALYIGIILILFGPVLVFAQGPDAKAHAQEVLNLARAALGGDKALNSVRSLSASGDFRSGPDGMEVPGTMQLEILFPDNLMRTLKYSPTQTTKVTTIEAMNDAGVWTESKTKQSGAMVGSSSTSGGGMGRGGGRMGGMRRGSSRPSTGGSAGGGGEPSGNLPAPNFREAPDAQQLKLDFSCLMMALLLHDSDLLKYAVSYQENLDVDGTQAESLKITTGNGLEIRLAIDKKGHRPIMVAYKVPVPGAAAGEKKQTGISESEFAENQIYFSEYKSIHQKGIGDIWLPHQITMTRNGETIEDMHIKQFQLNPNLKPKYFEKKH